MQMFPYEQKWCNNNVAWNMRQAMEKFISHFAYTIRNAPSKSTSIVHAYLYIILPSKIKSQWNLGFPDKFKFLNEIEKKIQWTLTSDSSFFTRNFLSHFLFLFSISHFWGFFWLSCITYVNHHPITLISKRIKFYALQRLIDEIIDNPRKRPREKETERERESRANEWMATRGAQRDLYTCFPNVSFHQRF